MGTVPVAGSTFTFEIPGLVSQADTKLFQTAPTIAAGDFQRSINGGALGNLANLPVVTPAGGSPVQVVLSAAETTAAGAGGRINIVWRDAAGAEWCDGGLLLFVHAAEPSVATIADAVWDEVLTGATHDVPTSAGRRLRQLGAASIASGTAQSGTANTIVLEDGEASTTDNIYNENLIAITGGTGIGQCRLIAEYDGDTLTAIVDRNWDVTPAADSEYQVMAFSGILLTDHGLARAGAASTIQLATTASAIDDVYVGSMIALTTGIGPGQARLITAYNGTTKTATVSPAWTTAPDVTTVYKIIPVGRAIVASMQADSLDASALATDAVTEIVAAVVAAVWAAAERTLTTPAATLTTSTATNIVLYCHATNSVTIGDITVSAARTALYLSIKGSLSDDDEDALMQVTEADGLTILNGAAATTPAWGSLTVGGGLDAVTVELLDHAMALLAPGTYTWDLKQILAAGAAVPLATGTCTMYQVVTQALT